MSLFATFVGWIAAKFGALLVALHASRLAARVAVLTAVATSYVALVVLFNTTLSPMWSALVGHEYGQLLGLLFPPVAGSVLAALVTVWVAVLGYRYVSGLASASVR